MSKDAQRIDFIKEKWYNGFNKKELTSKAEPQIDGILVNFGRRC
jgi:hypothetical protein